MSKKRRSSGREAYECTSSLENDGRKNPLKWKKFAEFQPLIVSFILFVRFNVVLISFSDFFGLVKYARPSGVSKGEADLGEKR